MMYQDAQRQTYIPDFTGTDLSVMKPEQFKRNGDYVFIIYAYYRGTHKTNRSLVTGNAQTGDVHWHTMDNMGGLLGPVVEFHNNKGMPYPLERTVLAYTKLMLSLRATEGKR